MSMGEDEYLEEAYEDRYTTQGDWDQEDWIDPDEERDSDEELLTSALVDGRARGYVGQHRA